MVCVVVHSNPYLDNQIESAEWVRQGFERHGVACEVTADKHRAADIHVVQGPHYALREWLGKPNVLWLNRTFYGDSRYDLSIGWLQPDGGRWFKNEGKTEPNGVLPKLLPLKKKKTHAVVFTDYGQDPAELMAYAAEHYEHHWHRAHPAQYPEESFVPLAAVWPLNHVAIGHTSTVLVEAAINGLHVDALDPRSVCYDIGPDREGWLIRLSWAVWHYDKIIDGSFWDHLC